MDAMGSSAGGAGSGDVLDTLKVEADILRRKHQRKGVEYKVRQMALRPSLSRGGPEGTPRKPLGSPVKGRPGTAPDGGLTLPSIKGATATESFGASAAPAEGGGLASMDDYDPRRQQELEAEALVAELTRMRETASTLHHQIGSLGSEKQGLENELEQLRYEDGVERERAEGLKEVERTKAEVGRLEALGEEADAYRLTLEFMLNRCRRERVEMLAMQKAFEESLAAHSNELELKRGLLQKVSKSRETEMAALAAMQADVKKQLGDMDKKLEGRRQELRLRQEKARLIAANIDLDAAVSSAGKLSAEEERLMMEKLKAVSIEAAEIRTARVRAQADADAAEAEFNSLRFAAGVTAGPAAAGGGAGGDAAKAEGSLSGAGAGGDAAAADEEGGDALVYTEPDPDAIIDRFAALEMEMQHIEGQVSDYTSRLRTLRARHAVLASAKQPTARDARDELDSDLGTVDRLTATGDAAKRALDTAREELREAETVKMQLQQSISMLTQRLTAIPLPDNVVPPSRDGADAAAAASEDELVVRRILEQVGRSMSSEWCRGVHLSLLDAVSKLHAMMRAVDPEESAGAYRDARAWLESSLAADGSATAGGAAPPPRRAGPPSSPVHAAQRPGSRAASRGGAGGQPQKLTALIGDDEELEEAIEALVAGNEWSVRVKPSAPAQFGDAATVMSSVDDAGAGAGVVPAKVLTEAAQAFERQLRESVAFTLKGGSAGGGGAGDDGDRGLGGTTRSRRSRLPTDGPGDFVPAEGDRSEAGSTAIGFGRRTSVVGAATAVLKPKPRELTRMFAAALQMSGNDVEEHLMSPARKDPEEVITRDALKRATKTTIRQMMRSRRAAEAKAASSGDGAGRGPASPEAR